MDDLRSSIGLRCHRVGADGSQHNDQGTANLKPLGSANSALHVELVPPAGTHSTAHASVAVNSLGLIDNLQIAATGLEPGKKYRFILIGGSEPQGLIVFTAGIGGAAIAQTFGTLKEVVKPSTPAVALKLEVRSGVSGRRELVLQQSAAAPTVTP